MRAKLLYLATIFIVLVSLTTFSFTVSATPAENDSTSIKIPSGYTYVTQSTIDDNLQLINEINFSRDDFEKYLQDNKIILFAYNSNNKNEIIMKYEAAMWDDNFDINLLDQDSFGKMAEKLSSGLDYERVEIGDYVYVRTKIAGSDSGGSFNVLKYVTIQKGNLISVEFNFSGEYNADNVAFTERVMSDFKTPTGRENTDNTASSAIEIAAICLVAIAILAGIAVAVYLIVTIIIDVRNKRNTSDVAPYVKIKRRKF